MRLPTCAVAAHSMKIVKHDPLSDDSPERERDNVGYPQPAGSAARHMHHRTLRLRKRKLKSVILLLLFFRACQDGADGFDFALAGLVQQALVRTAQLGVVGDFRRHGVTARDAVSGQRRQHAHRQREGDEAAQP